MTDLKAMSDDELDHYIDAAAHAVVLWVASEMGQLAGCVPQCAGCSAVFGCAHRRVVMLAALEQVTRSIYRALPTGTVVA